MPCFNPTRVLTRDGVVDWSLDWRYPLSNTQRLNLPCGACLGCRQASCRDWSIRAFHESLAHSEDWTDPETHISATLLNASVITLTYNDEHLPDSSYLKHDDFQRFMKRLIVHRIRHQDSVKPLRYFMCGEYGGQTARPHYHAIIFGESFDDRYATCDRSGHKQEMSYLLDHLWSQKPHSNSPPTPIGRATVDSFHYAAAAYVAGYIAKKLQVPKQTGPITNIVDTSTGLVTINHPAPEYRHMSQGLGRAWINTPANLTRTYALDCVEINEWKFHPPRYYDLVHKKRRPKAHAELLKRRARAAHESAISWTPERCASAQEIRMADMAGRTDIL